MDCRVDLGGEDGCSHGGTVSCWGAVGSDSRSGLECALLVVLMMSISSACSREKPVPVPGAVELLKAVTPADPAKFPSLEESRHWSNPYLVVRPETVGLLSGVAANEEQILKPEEVLKALAQLPASAWPYGRAVAVLVEAKTTSSEKDKIAIRRNRGIVAGELQSAQVTINWIPSS